MPTVQGTPHRGRGADGTVSDGKPARVRPRWRQARYSGEEGFVFGSLCVCVFVVVTVLAIALFIALAPSAGAT